MPSTTATPIPDSLAKDAIIGWFKGEFAAANAIIDALCNHLSQLEGSDYQSVFAAIHRRRMNWIPILHMQKYFSIADVAIQLGQVAAHRATILHQPLITHTAVFDSLQHHQTNSSHPKILQQGLKEKEHYSSEDHIICSKHEKCELRRTNIKMTKAFVVRELVKGQMVNVVKGLKLYEDIFTESELSKLTDYINELRAVGRKGALSGETFILFNQQLKGKKRELIQLGVPIFAQIKEEGKSNNIEPIPPVLQAVVDHLVQWHLIPESRKPNSCIINYFDEGEYSQPYMKPPHLDQPISTLVLSESSMGFGRILASDHSGNFKSPLMLKLKQGSLLVMRGNSADMARHVICPSPSKRVCLTFCKVRPAANQVQTPISAPLTTAMAVWQPGVPQRCKLQNGAFDEYDPMKVIPNWGLIHPPLVMLAPMRPMVMNHKRLRRGGTGVFLPWTVGPKKHMKHLPPRAQKNRPLALPPPTKTQMVESCPGSSA